MRIAVSALGQNLTAPTGLLSYFSQLARLLPQVDPYTEYKFVVTRGSEAIVGAGSGAKTITLGSSTSGNYVRLFLEHFRLGPLLRRNNVEILYMANAGVSPLVLPRSVRLVQAVFGFHQFESGNLGWLKAAYRKFFFAMALRRADRIVLNSEYSRQLLHRHGRVSDDKVRVIPHGVNARLFHNGPLGADESEAVSKLEFPGRFVAFVSQMYPYKNVDVAIEAFCRFVAATGSDHAMVIVGQFQKSYGNDADFKRSLVTISERYGLADRLKFYERLPVKALRAVYCLADVYIQSSTSETFGRTTQEAMACGCPVIAARAAATPEILGDAGVYYEGRDVSGCAALLERLLGDPAFRQSCIEKGLARAAQNSTDEEARRLAAVFKEVLTPAKSRRENRS